VATKHQIVRAICGGCFRSKRPSGTDKVFEWSATENWSLIRAGRSRNSTPERGNSQHVFQLGNMKHSPALIPDGTAAGSAFRTSSCEAFSMRKISVLPNYVTRTRLRISRQAPIEKIWKIAEKRQRVSLAVRVGPSREMLSSKRSARTREGTKERSRRLKPSA